MKPRHFWWLIEVEGERKQSRLSESDRKGILEALRGNPKGGFW